MSDLVALTRIRHGKGDEGVVTVLPGESVDSLPKEVIRSLAASGAVVRKSMAKVLQPDLFPDKEEEEERPAPPTPPSSGDGSGDSSPAKDS